MTESLMGEQVSMLDLVSPFGKTSQDRKIQTTEKISVPCLKRSAKSATKQLAYLDLRGTQSGLLQDASWEMVIRLPGVSSTLNTSDSPSDARECTLLQILELNAPEKYNLSAKACLGVLRRAEKRGKQLPPMLKEALMEKVELG